MPKKKLTLDQLDAKWGKDWNEDYRNNIRRLDHSQTVQLLADMSGVSTLEIVHVLKRHGIDQWTFAKQKRTEAEQNNRTVKWIMIAVFGGMSAFAALFVFVLASQGSNGSSDQDACSKLGGRTSLDGDRCVFN